MRTGLRHGGAFLGMAIALGACGGGDGGGGNNTPLSIAKAAPSGDAQTDTIGANLAQALRVEVQEDGFPAAARTVAWLVTSGGGQVTASSSETDLTGTASMTWKLGTALGAQTVRASLGGAAGSPLTFTATATAGNPSQIVKTAGDNQVAIAGQGFATALSVAVRDRADHPVPGVTINWAVASGSLVLDAPVSQTNAQGVASIPVDAGPAAGPATLTASFTAGVGASTTFNLSVTSIGRQVTVGAGTVFTSANNGSSNPAVDTVQAGQSVLWTSAGGTHTVRASPPSAFTSSGNLTNGQTHVVIFNNPGTFQYDCAIHGNAMTGRIVVQ